MLISHNLTTFANVVALLVHLWGGCCAHHDHSMADHDHPSYDAHRHIHADHPHADSCPAHVGHGDARHDGNAAEHDDQPLDLCEHGSCDYFQSSTVQAPTPELATLAQWTGLPLITHAQLEISATLLRPSRYCTSPGVRLHQPLQVWLI